jgi:hypothetical protein
VSVTTYWPSAGGVNGTRSELEQHTSRVTSSAFLLSRMLMRTEKFSLVPSPFFVCTSNSSGVFAEPARS